jgi:hypothetical protein
LRKRRQMDLSQVVFNMRGGAPQGEGEEAEKKR